MKKGKQSPGTPVEYGSICFWDPRSLHCKRRGIFSGWSPSHHHFLMGATAKPIPGRGSSSWHNGFPTLNHPSFLTAWPMSTCNVPEVWTPPSTWGPEMDAFVEVSFGELWARFFRGLLLVIIYVIIVINYNNHKPIIDIQPYHKPSKVNQGYFTMIPILTVNAVTSQWGCSIWSRNLWLDRVLRA